MTAYYNEHDPYAAQWLRNLITAGHIAPGDVDERSIEDVLPSDLAGYKQCHFFAGIGVWSLALRRAGWPDDRSVWTGSCPCQPFSSAGKGAGFADERHLWPHFHWLIEQCRPPIVLGEQVASKDGLAWLDLVSADLEGSGYTSGAVDTCAAGFGAPHIRQRLYWVAHATGIRRDEQWSAEGAAVQGQFTKRGRGHAQPGHAGELPGRPKGLGSAGGVGDATVAARERDTGSVSGAKAQIDGERLGIDGHLPVGSEHAGSGVVRGQPGPVNGLWRDADWLFCRDGKWRPIEPGTFPLAHGVACRMDKLRAFGNAISPQVAESFIGAYLESRRWQDGA